MIASWFELKGTMNGVGATDQIPSPNSCLSNDKALPHYLRYKMNLAFFP